jgi:phosphate-selective porin OprO/OprP
MKTVPLALAALAVLAVPPLQAQERPAGPPVPLAEKPAETPAEKPAEKKNPPVSAGPEGFSIQNESGDFRVQIRGYTHFDGRFFPGDDAGVATDTFLMRRVRPIVQGTLGKYFEFNFTPDFGGGVAVVQDAWFDFGPSSKLRVRVGKFKSPVGLERLQSSPALHFVERAFPTAIVPSRDVGVQLYGELAGGIVAYQAAVLDGAPDGGSVDTDVNDGKDLAGRLTLSPFKTGGSALKELGFGISGTTGQQTGALPGYRSPGQISVVTAATGVTADGTRKRYSPQLLFYSGPFGLLAEYAQSESEVKKADGSHATFEAKAWQATATVALTGDKAAYAGVRPRKPFDPAKGQWGALELVARIQGLEVSPASVNAGLIDATRSVRKIRAWAAGLNWSLTRNVKQVVDFEHASFTGGAPAGRNRESENVVFIRTQFSF